MITLNELINEAARPLAGTAQDHDPLMDLVGDAQVVLLGESTHGTHEFYHERAEITKRLITEKGFGGIVVEADWPDAFRVNRFVRAAGNDADAVDALGGFKRFPQWMWRNADVLDFVGWLRAHNDACRSTRRKVGFYGLDLYSLQTSIDSVIGYLSRVDPASARRARKRYEHLGRFGGDTRTYGLASGLGMVPGSEAEAVNELIELRLREALYVQDDSRMAADEFFSAEQNALVVRNAEQYYRNMFLGDVSSWNLRERHMMDTLLAVVTHLKQSQESAKVVVWAHSSHLGNARATQLGERGELNLGQLARERLGHHSVSIGFTTYGGTVTAAPEWDAPAERMDIHAAMPESYEALFHQAGHPRFWLEFERHPDVSLDLRGGRLERAIGVVYRPETESTDNYFFARLPDQFDAILHFDRTRAVEPLERTTAWEPGEVEETFPTGL